MASDVRADDHRGPSAVRGGHRGLGEAGYSADSLRVQLAAEDTSIAELSTVWYACRMHQTSSVSLKLGGLLLIWGCTTTAAPDSGACQRDTDCKGDRVCREGSCIDPTDGGKSGTPDGGAVVPGEASDDCANAGGTRLPRGACLKNCVYDEDATNGDRDDDCDDLGGRCTAVYTGKDRPFCAPAEVCATAADCPAGWTCATLTSSGYKFCAIECTSTSECASGLGCITDCPNGTYSHEGPGFCNVGIGTNAQVADPTLTCRD